MNEQELLAKYEQEYFVLRKRDLSHQEAVYELRSYEYNGDRSEWDQIS